MREKIGAFKNLLGINGHPRGQRRGQRHASMPPGTFVGPPNALESQRTQERSLSLPADEESMAPEPPVDPALLEPADARPQSPGISHEDSLESLAQFEANPGILSEEPVLTVTLLTIWSRFQCIAKCLIASTPLTWVHTKQLSDFPTSRQQQVIYGRY